MNSQEEQPGGKNMRERIMEYEHLYDNKETPLKKSLVMRQIVSEI